MQNFNNTINEKQLYEKHWDKIFRSCKRYDPMCRRRILKNIRKINVEKIERSHEVYYGGPCILRPLIQTERYGLKL